MSKTQSIIVEYDLPHPPDRVWRALTDPKLLAKWLMPNDMVPVVGHKFNFKTQARGDWDGKVYCEVLLVEPLKRFRYSWCGGVDTLQGYGHTLNTVVTWTLTPGGAGTKLLLEHEGFRDENVSAYEAMSGGWRTHVAERMAHALAEG
jgi:uncharacterized protein YndB with AHSA1/START domain